MIAKLLEAKVVVDCDWPNIQLASKPAADLGYKCHNNLARFINLALSLSVYLFVLF